MAKEANPKVRQAQVFLVDLVLTVAGVGLVWLGARAVWYENLGLAATALGAGLILLFSSTIHRFESLKGLGVEAKTRALDQAIGKAEVTLTQVKALTELTGANLIQLHATVGRYGPGLSPLEAHEHSRKVAQMLRDIGSDEQTIRAALVPWARAAASDLWRVRSGQIHNKIADIQARLGEESRDASHEEKLNFSQRQMALSVYQIPDTDNFRRWPLSTFASRHKAFVLGMPEPLEPADQQALLDAIDKDAVEYDSLERQLDFADRSYWTEQNFSH